MVRDTVTHKLIGLTLINALNEIERIDKEVQQATKGVKQLENTIRRLLNAIDEYIKYESNVIEHYSRASNIAKELGYNAIKDILTSLVETEKMPHNSMDSNKK